MEDLEEKSVYLELDDDSIDEDENTEVKIVSIRPEDMNNHTPKKFGMIVCNEPNCRKEFRFIRNFRMHLVDEHNFEQSCKKMSFPSIKDFEEWKKIYERKNLCSFSKRSGSRSNLKNNTSNYLYCNRSGLFSNTKSAKAKRVRTTFKSGNICTCSIVYVVSKDGEVIVHLYPNHYGHDTEINKLPTHKKKDWTIDPDESNDMETESDNGVSSNRNEGTYEIMDPLEGEKSSDISKHVEKTQNISNLNKCLLTNFFESEFDSLDVWCAEINNYKENFCSPLVYYKPVGYKSDTLSSYELCLVLMTDYMRNMFQLFSDKLIYITTMPMPKLQYHVTILFIIDEFNEPFPVALMVTNKIHSAYLGVFFETLKGHLNSKNIELSTRIFMTDNNVAAFEIWNQVMKLESKHMICPRYIDEQWRRYLVTIPNEDLQCEIYDQLSELLDPGEVDEAASEAMLNRAVTKLESNSSCSKFLAYFQKNCLNKYEQWSGFSLKQVLNLSSAVNFEKNVSEVSTILEAKYKKYAKNCVKVLQQLFKKLVSYQHQRISNISAALNASDINHRMALKADLKKVFPTEKDGMWRVVLDSEAIVQRNHVLSTYCTLNGDIECSLICKQCEICYHKLTCSCNTYKRQFVICIHVHLVVRMVRHTLLYNVLKDTNQDVLEEEKEEIKPAEFESEVIQVIDGNAKIPEREIIDLSTIRKNIIQSMANTQDNLYLVHDEQKLKTLLHIVEELNNLTVEWSSNSILPNQSPTPAQTKRKNIQNVKMKKANSGNLKSVNQTENVIYLPSRNIELYMDAENQMVEKDVTIPEENKIKIHYERVKDKNQTPVEKKSTAVMNKSIKLVAISNTENSVNRFWNIEIECNRKTIFIPIYDQNNIVSEIEQTINKVNKNQLIFQNVLDTSLPQSILKLNKQMIIEQLTNIVKEINSGKQLSEVNNKQMKGKNHITVKLAEKSKLTTNELPLKRKIEQFSQENLLLKNIKDIKDGTQNIEIQSATPNDLKINKTLVGTYGNGKNKMVTSPKLIENCKNSSKSKKNPIEIIQINKNEKEITDTKTETNIEPSQEKKRKLRQIENETQNKIETNENVKFNQSEINEIPKRNSIQTSDQLKTKEKNSPQLKKLKINKSNEKLKQNESDTKVTSVHIEIETETLSDKGIKSTEENNETLVTNKVDEEDSQTNIDMKQETEQQKTEPRRVVRTLRPQLQNKYSTNSNTRGCLKVLKPQIK